MIKVFGVGNILLCDDGIGVKIISEIRNKLEELSDEIEVISGENHVEYCLDRILEEDFIIIVDSTYFMKRPGTVISKSFAKCDEFIEEVYTVHDLSLLKILRTERRSIKGYLIGVEVEKVDYSLELSPTLTKKFDAICMQVYENIKFILKGEKLI